MKKIICSTLLVVLSQCLMAQKLESRELSGYQDGYILGLQKEDKSLNFLLMGDFGRYGQFHQKEVAVQMGKAAATIDSDFVISVGDNFYPNGVRSTKDYSWIASYENIYTAYSLQNDWYVALGNHDYRGNIQAEIDYSDILKYLWIKENILFPEHSQDYFLPRKVRFVWLNRLLYIALNVCNK